MTAINEGHKKYDPTKIRIRTIMCCESILKLTETGSMDEEAQALKTANYPHQQGANPGGAQKTARLLESWVVEEEAKGPMAPVERARREDQ